MSAKYSPGATMLSQRLKQLGVEHPSFHVVLGSGFKDSLNGGIPASFIVKGEVAFSDLPGLKVSTAPGHVGKYVVVEHQNSKEVGLIQVGRLHGYEGLDSIEVVQPVIYSRELGADDFFITNAAGGIDPAHQVGDVMIITDHVNLTGKNPLLGANPKRHDGTEWGPRFPDLTKLYDREWRKEIEAGLKAEMLKVHQGVYMGVLGPAYETPAEIRFFRMIGTHAVGMSTVWETIALKHAGARICALSLISNIAAGLSEGLNGEFEELNHEGILEACKTTSVSILRAILLTVEKKYG